MSQVEKTTQFLPCCFQFRAWTVSCKPQVISEASNKTLCVAWNPKRCKNLGPRVHRLPEVESWPAHTHAIRAVCQCSLFPTPARGYRRTAPPLKWEAIWRHHDRPNHPLVCCSSSSRNHCPVRRQCHSKPLDTAIQRSSKDYDGSGTPVQKQFVQTAGQSVWHEEISNHPPPPMRKW